MEVIVTQTDNTVDVWKDRELESEVGAAKLPHTAMEDDGDHDSYNIIS